MFKSMLKKKNPLRSGDLEGALHKTPNGINSNVPDTSNDPGPRTERGGRPVIVIRNLDAPAPSLTLNTRNQLSRGELYLVAVIGTLLQLGVLVFSGCATYHPTLRSRWLKDGNPAADYAFPCNAAGTLLLVAGMLICAHVVEGSTSETRYRPVEGKARVVWLQKSGTVNDQAFESFAIFPRQPQTLITTSQRWGAGGSQPILGETIAVIGAMVSLCGFVAQFVGLRGLHWSSSIAQLIAIAFMVALRAWVRRNLAQLPASHRLLSGHEMDWLAMTLAGDLARASWLNPPRMNDGELNRQSRPPATLLALQDADSTNADEPENPLQTRAQRAMMLRRDLGEVADWQGPASAEAIALARAIEIVMDTLLGMNPGGNGKLTWHLSFPTSSEDSRNESVTFRVEQLGNGNWKAFSDELEAALSLWLYSVAELENEPENDLGDDQQMKPGGRGKNEGGRLEFKPIRSKDDTLRLLGQSTEALVWDLGRWVRMDSERTNNGNILQVEKHRIVGCASNWGPGSYIYEQPIHDDNNSASGNSESTWTMAADSSTPLATLFAQHMFTAFMWAVAKKMESPIPGGADIRPSERDDAPPIWTSFALRNAKLHKMAQDIQGAGLGNLADVYLAIIPPLSIERRLPQPDAIVELARKHANPHGHMQPGQRSNATAAYLWLLQVSKGLQEDILTRAVALLLEHLRAIIDGVELLEAQHVDEEMLTKALQDVDYGAQGRPWNYLIPKLKDLPGHMWALNETEESDISVIKDMLGWTPLLYTITTFMGADVNARDLHGRTPLHYACQHDDKSWIPSLLRAGAEMNARDADGMVPLHDAARCGTGADVNIVDAFGNTPLHRAAYAGSKAALLGCLAYANPKLRNHNGRTALHLAAIGEEGSVEERKEVVKALMGKAGVDKEPKDYENWTLLQLAARFGHSTAIDAKDDWSYTPLHLAVGNWR
ncbi:hypothetical protein B0I37DRAFT_387349 [Chaetomium sp. MPI-CAGE-AT-0009]|nr:hypothetical protein B0I37DRAFT_387349 [Chaetomium sp. MPI-CAGE-AT-0009]